MKMKRKLSILAHAKPAGVTIPIQFILAFNPETSLLAVESAEIAGIDLPLTKFILPISPEFVNNISLKVYMRNNITR